MWLKTALLFAWLIGSYAAAMFANVSSWQAALLVVSIGLAMAGIGFWVMHDANHCAYSSGRQARRGRWGMRWRRRSRSSWGRARESDWRRAALQGGYR